MTVSWSFLGAVLAAFAFLMSCVGAQAAQPLDGSSQVVAGVVIDAETLAPVAAAVVGAGGVRVITDNAGRFAVTLPPGVVALDIEASDYFEIKVSLAARPTATALEIALVRRTTILDTVVVRGAPIAAAAASQDVAPVEVLRTAGALDNIFRTLDTLPGVSATMELGGYLSVRGGSPDQNLTMLDGVEVHDPYRLFGLTSAFNPETVARFDLATGGFSAKYGDRLSSMLTIDTRDGAAERHVGGSASLSVTDANVIVEGGWPQDLPGSWLVTGRRTYYDLVADLVSDQQFPAFTDVQSKAVWLPRPGRRLTMFGLISRQGGRLDVDDDDLEARVYDDTENDLGWARAESTLGNRGHAMVVAGFSETRVGSGFEASLVDKGRRSNAPGASFSRRAEVAIDVVSRIRDLSLRHELGWAAGAHAIGGGVELHRLTSALDFAVTGDRNPNAGNGSSQQGGAGLPTHLDSRLAHTRAATWLEGTWALGNRLSAQTGLRLDRVGLTTETLLSPRLSATWGLTDSTRIRAAAGRYTQSPGYEKLAQSDYLLDLTGAGTTRLRSQTAWLGSLGLEQELAGAAVLRVDGYYKHFADVLIGQLESETERSARLARYDFPAALAASVPAEAIITSRPDNHGRGRAYGLDVQLTRTAAPAGTRLRGWASYSWSRAEREAYGLRYPFEYDRRHAATFVSSLRLTRRWDAAATFRVASGFPRTAPIGLRVAGTEDAADSDGDGVFDEIVPERDVDGRLVYTADFGGVANLQRGRLPVFARLDARLTWRPLSGRWEIYAEVINVLNRKNAGALNPTLEHDPTSDRPKLVEKPAQSLPLLPTVGVRFRF